MGFIGRLVRLAASIFLILSNWVVLPLIFWAMPRMIFLMVVSALALLRGVPTTVDLIEEEWAQGAGRRLIDNRLDRTARRVFRVAAYITLMLGWIIMSAATVGVIYLIVLIV